MKKYKSFFSNTCVNKWPAKNSLSAKWISQNLFKFNELKIKQILN